MFCACLPYSCHFTASPLYETQSTELTDITTDKPFFQASESRVEQHKTALQTPKILLKYKQQTIPVKDNTLRICMHFKTAIMQFVTRTQKKRQSPVNTFWFVQMPSFWNQCQGFTMPLHHRTPRAFGRSFIVQVVGLCIRTMDFSYNRLFIPSVDYVYHGHSFCTILREWR